jgi:hypothetical protein
MCVPGIDSSTSTAEIAGAAGSYAWARAFGALGPAGNYISQLLMANKTAAESDWIAHSRSDEIKLEFKSGNTVTMNAADADPAILAAYGWGYDNDSGVLSTRIFFDSGEGVLSGSDLILQDGVLTPPPIGVIPGSMVELPDDAVALAGSASLLTKKDFPDARLAENEKWVKGGFVDDYGVQWTTLHLVSDTGTLLFTRGWPTADFPVSSNATPAVPPGSGTASSTSNSFANDLAEEHARNYSAGVAQADAAQQSEYTSNLAAKDAANQSRIDQNMAASASGTGSAPGVPAAPGYGPADVAASGQPGQGVPPAPGYGSGDVAANGQPVSGGSETGGQSGIFARQGFSKDGRIVPNIFKVINQDLWTDWGKSHGAEAVIMFPFVLAMSGAVFLPQAVNDIPNIPTLLATALTEWDNGNPGKALEAAGDGLGAVGMLGELAAGAEAFSDVSQVTSNGSQATETWAGVYKDPWNPINEVTGSSRIAAQAPAECGLVCGETMMRGSGVTAEDLLTELGDLWGSDGVRPDELETAMNALDPKFVLDPTIEKPYYFDASTIEEVTAADIQNLHESGDWIAGIKGTNGSPGHAVMVEGLSPSGNVLILDPIGAREYEVTLEEFSAAWTRSGIFRR